MKVNLKDTALCPGIKNVNSQSIICVAGGLSNFQTAFNSFVFILHLKNYLQIFYTIKGNLVNPRKTIFSFSQPSSLTSILRKKHLEHGANVKSKSCRIN